MRRGAATAVSLGIACLGASASAQSAGSDLASPRSVAMGESLRAAATGALATTLNPAGIVLARSYVLEATYGYRPEDHANIQAISVCDSVTTRVGACLYYDHLSADLTFDDQGSRHRHEVGLAVATPLSDGLSLGVTNKYVDYGEEPSAAASTHSYSGYLLDAGLTLRAVPSFTVAFVGYNLVGADEALYARALGFGLAWNLGSQLLVAADGRYDLEHDHGRWGGGVEYTVSGGGGQQGFPLRLGYVYDSALSASYVTGGLGVMTPRVALDLGARTQVSNGDELMLQLSLRLFFPS